jgi:hypothetical protein
VQLPEFCAKNPQITVGIWVPGFEIISLIEAAAESVEYTPWKFLEAGMILTVAFWGEDITPMAPEYLDDTFNTCDLLVTRMLQKHRDTIRGLHNRTRNLRFYPHKLDWDVELFRSGALEMWMEEALDPTALLPGAVNTWVK